MLSSTNLSPLLSVKLLSRNPIKSAVYELELSISKHLSKEDTKLEEEEEKARTTLGEERSLKGLFTHIFFKSLLSVSKILESVGGFSGPLATNFDKVYVFMALVFTATELFLKSYGSRSGSRMLANAVGPMFCTAAKYFFHIGFGAFAISKVGVYLNLSGLVDLNLSGFVRNMHL